MWRRRGYPSPVKLPQRVGDYTLLEQIGAGAFGTVYRARVEGDLGFRQEVAVKLVDGSRAKQSPGLITSLADEAQFLARVSHPHVVAVRRFVRADHEFLGEAWLMEMELVRGVSLARLLRLLGESNTRLPVDSVLSLLLESLDALVYAHGLKTPDGRSQSLVHRDMKPANVVLTPEGRVVLMDFGIARYEQVDSGLTTTGMSLGTPLYMAPEQAVGAELDARADLYSLGVLLYELVTGQPPFQGTTTVALYLEKRGDQFKPSLELNPDVPADLDELIADLLRYETDQRPENAHAVLARLQ